MKQKSLVRQYLHEYRWSMGIFALFSGIFLLVFILYDVKAAAVAYAALLCGFFGAILLGIHFREYAARHRERQQMLANIGLLYEQLPAGETLAEQDYQSMIRTLGELCSRQYTELMTSYQEREDYYTTWVHQIKTPIAVLQMMLQAEDTEEHHAMQNELFRIEQYVEMALVYVRLKEGSSDLVYQSCRLDDVLRKAVRKYAAQFVGKRIRLVYQPTEAVVVTDEKWLQFIVEQLLSNAVKYTRKGSVEISVDASQTLTIRDTGIGIAPEDLPRIFEKGFTGYNGRADKKATGLGLYLSKQAARKLGTEITTVSEPGKGTAFSICLKKNTVTE